MTCLDFIDSIGYDQFKSYIEYYFDQIMALYKLCGACDITSICSEVHEDEISFRLLFANTADVVTMRYVLSTNGSINIYGSLFNTSCEDIDENTLRVTISPCT